MNLKFLNKTLCLVTLLGAVYSSNSYSMDEEDNCSINNMIKNDNNDLLIQNVNEINMIKNDNDDLLIQNVNEINMMMGNENNIIAQQSYTRDNVPGIAEFDKFKKGVDSMISGEYSNENIQSLIKKEKNEQYEGLKLDVLEEKITNINNCLVNANIIYNNVKEKTIKPNIENIMNNNLTAFNKAFREIKSIDLQISDLTKQRAEKIEIMKVLGDVIREYKQVDDTWKKNIEQYREGRHILKHISENISKSMGKEVKKVNNTFEQIQTKAKDISDALSTVPENDMYKFNPNNINIDNNNNSINSKDVIKKNNNLQIFNNNINFVKELQNDNDDFEQNNDNDGNDINNTSMAKSVANTAILKKYKNIKDEVKHNEENNKNNTVNNDDESKIDI